MRVLCPATEEIEHFLQARRSIRTYKSKPVSREMLARLIDTARYAPSGHNRQPVHWLVIQGDDEVQRMAGITVDWMRAMIEEQSPMAEMLHLDRPVAAWELGKDRVPERRPLSHCGPWGTVRTDCAGFLHDRSHLRGISCVRQRVGRVLGRILQCSGHVFPTYAAGTCLAGRKPLFRGNDDRVPKIPIPATSPEERGVCPVALTEARYVA